MLTLKSLCNNLVDFNLRILSNETSPASLRRNKKKLVLLLLIFLITIIRQNTLLPLNTLRNNFGDLTVGLFFTFFVFLLWKKTISRNFLLETLFRSLFSQTVNYEAYHCTILGKCQKLIKIAKITKAILNFCGQKVLR